MNLQQLAILAAISATVLYKFGFGYNIKFLKHNYASIVVRRMAIDDFLVQKLDSIKRSYDALTERLADPDVVNDRVQSLSISRERSSIEKTVLLYEDWRILESEKSDLIELDQSGDSDTELREIARAEIKEIAKKQEDIEKEINLLLLPRDPNDDRNVMLEVRAGTVGDEASIWAGDIVNMYRKYAESQGWKVSPVSETEGEFGGYKTCIIQITGDYVYSKLKYEVSSKR